jgi:predicted transcriptional regulator
MQAKTVGRPVSRGPLERLTVLVNETVKERLRNEAEATGASMGWIVQEALVAYLKKPAA